MAPHDTTRNVPLVMRYSKYLLLAVVTMLTVYVGGFAYCYGYHGVWYTHKYERFYFHDDYVAVSQGQRYSLLMDKTPGLIDWVDAIYQPVLVRWEIARSVPASADDIAYFTRLQKVYPHTQQGFLGRGYMGNYCHRLNWFGLANAVQPKDK